MQSTIHCTCGYTRSGRDEEELYSLIRGHIDRSHPERHQLIVREEFGSLVPHDNDHPYPSHLLTAGRASSSPVSDCRGRGAVHPVITAVELPSKRLEGSAGWIT